MIYALMKRLESPSFAERSSSLCQTASTMDGPAIGLELACVRALGESIVHAGLLGLPTEVLFEIVAHHLSTSDLFSLSATCKRMRAIVASAREVRICQPYTSLGMSRRILNGS